MQLMANVAGELHSLSRFLCSLSFGVPASTLMKRDEETGLYDHYPNPAEYCPDLNEE